MTLEQIKQLCVEEQQNLVAEWSEFLTTLGPKETEFVNKMVEWRLNKNHTLLYRMFNEKIRYTSYQTFIENLMHFIRYDIHDDGGCKIRWVKYKFYVEDLDPSDETSTDLVDCSPEDEQGYPLVVDHENYTSLENILKAMKVAEQRDLKRTKEIDESQWE
jgi:hypothetical protein